MKFYEDLLDYIDKVKTDHSLKMDELEKQFKPKCWESAKNGKTVWKMNDLPTLELTEKELGEILEKVSDIFKESKHLVYNDDYFKTGSTVHICEATTKKYNYFYLYLNHRYVVPMFIRTVDISDRKLQIHPPENNSIGAGTKALQQINKDLRESNLIDNKDTLTSALVPESKSKWKSILKMCVPNQIGWYSTTDKCVISRHCFKADVSSAFPFQLTKSIPTLKNSIIKYDYKMEPTEEFPFVFTYEIGKTFGRVEIYNELDTDIDIKSPYMVQVANQILHSETRLQYLNGEYEGRKINLNPIYRGKVAEKFICIACKKADISLAEVMQLHYNIKNTTDNEEIKNAEKMIMNALIGYMQRNNGGTLPFISAVVIARQNHRMLEICNELEQNGNIPIYIATDSIVWKFENEAVATRGKFLGSFTLEYENCEAYIVQVGAYQIKTNNKTITWCSYLPNDENKTNIEFGKLPLPKNSDIIIL